MENSTMTATAPAEGIHQHVPLADYLGWDCWSQSSIKAGLESMAHAKACKDGDLDRKVTDDMLLGSAMHTTFLEPELAAKKVACWEGGVRRGKEWDAFCAEHNGKTILTENQYAKLVGMSRSLRSHPQVRRWLSAIEATEASAVGRIEGVLMKGRADALMPVFIGDLKKVSDGNRRAIGRIVYDFGYHIQAAIYTRLFGRDRFVLITVEDSPPFDVCPYELSHEFIDRGWQQALGVLQRIKLCEAAGKWPGRSDVIETLDEPTWLNSSVTIS